MITKYIPQSIKRIIRRKLHYGKKYYCNLCDSAVSRFLPAGKTTSVIKELDIIGAGFHELSICPVCKASYRSRSIKLVLDELNLLRKDVSILHFAPEEALNYLLKRNSKNNYTCGDLEPERYSYYSKPIKLNLTKLHFKENTFDFIMCNHVLEHIPDDRIAMKELYRVLNKNGVAILQVPLSAKLEKTFEDSTIKTEEERLNKFGQSDHVRVYGKDYTKRLESVGFKVEVIDLNKYKLLHNFKKLALDLKEKVFVCRKL